jgi:ABC-type nitrate/sulfonate/bicarbonate transport system substrate-binding protein
MRRKVIVALVAGVVIIFVLLSLFFLRKPPGPGELEKLRIGVSADPISALVYIARQQNLFKRQGLDVSVENYEAGAYAVNDLLAGKVDVAAASEFVLVLQSFKRPDLRTIGSISSSDTNEMLARKDHGIEKPEDLRGKRVAVSKGTNSEFFLDTFLFLNGLHPDQIQIVYLKPNETVKALSEGKIDAGVNLFSYFDMIRKHHGGNMVSWSAQSGQDFYFLLITRGGVIKARPRVMTGLLKAVLEAETFLREHEREAQNIVAGALTLAPETVVNSWARTRFRVRLDQELLTLMEDEARWAIRNKLVDAQKVPNYLNLLYLEGLEKIRPEAVSVIH